ncbi:MAG: hypothetical protein ACI9ES_001535 [Oceanospirillaceae bacterium]|jgi:hypothetical protein
MVLAFSSLTYAEKSVSISTGYVSGNNFILFDVVSKNIYAQGVIDGILIAPMYGAPKSNLAELEKCTVGMTGQQLVAIFNKYLVANPEIWHKSMHTIVHRAMNVACKM